MTMLTSLPHRVRLIDVGPRDGLQNEKQPVPAAVKVELVHRLQAAGLKEIEVTSFVSPKWVPQMADNAEVMAGLQRESGVRYSVLTPNLQGFEAALKTKPDEIVVFGAASEAFSQKNINCSIAESIERFAPVVKAARDAGIAVRGAMSCTVTITWYGVSRLPATVATNCPGATSSRLSACSATYPLPRRKRAGSAMPATVTDSNVLASLPAGCGADWNCPGTTTMVMTHAPSTGRASPGRAGRRC